MLALPPSNGREKQHAAQLCGCRRPPEARNGDRARGLSDLRASRATPPLAAAEGTAATLQL